MINAIKYMDDLVETGFTQEQSKTTVSMWMELMNENLATKTEFKTLELETKSSLKELEYKIEKLDLKMEKEFVAVRNKMKEKCDKLESKVDLGFAKMQTNMKNLQLILLSSMTGLIVAATSVIGYLIKH